MANNLIQIKRSATTATPSSLNAGELAFSNATGGSGVLFIGSTDGGTVVPIGGVRNPGVLTANQALVANSAKGIDQVQVGNVVFVGAAQSLSVGGSTGTAGYVLTSNGNANLYWTNPATFTTNADAQYTWTNTQTFSNTITFSKDIKVGANLIANTTAITWNGNTTTSPTVTIANTGALTIGNSSTTQTTGQILVQNTAGVSTVNAGTISTTTLYANVIGSTANLSTSVNSALITVGTSVIANTSGVFTTGLVNAANFSTTGNANAANFYAGANTLLSATSLLWTGNTTTSPTITLANTGAFTIGNSSTTQTTSAFTLQNSVSVAVHSPLVVTLGNSSVTSAQQITVQNTAGTSTINTNAIGTTTLYANVVGSTANLSTSVNSAALTVGTTVIANTSGIFTSTVNATTVNTTSLYATGLVNAANFSTTGNANAANFYAGANTLLSATSLLWTGNTTTSPTITLANTGSFTIGNSSTTQTGSIISVANSTGSANISPSGFSGNGINITTINATNITTGTLPYAQIPANIVNTTGSFTLSGNTTLAGTNTVISSNLTVSGANLNVSSVNTNIIGNTNLGGTLTTITSNVSLTGANLTLTGTTIVGTTTDVTFRNATFSGNVVVSGNVITVNTSQLVVNDNIIQLAYNQTTADAVDSGFFSTAGNASAIWYSGIARIAASSNSTAPVFRVFVSNSNPNTAATIDTSANTITGYLQSYLAPYGIGGALIANSTAINITANSTVSSTLTANTLTLSTALAATSGGTGQASYATGDLLYASSTTALSKLSVPGSAANGQVLQITNNLPAYGTLDGGTF